MITQTNVMLPQSLCTLYILSKQNGFIGKLKSSIIESHSQSNNLIYSSNDANSSGKYYQVRSFNFLYVSHISKKLNPCILPELYHTITLVIGTSHFCECQFFFVTYPTSETKGRQSNVSNIYLLEKHAIILHDAIDQFGSSTSFPQTVSYSLQFFCKRYFLYV